MTTRELTGEQRARIVGEIASWWIESREMEYEDEELQKNIDRWVALEYSEIKQQWAETVGRWVLSRQDITLAHEDGTRIEDGDKIIEVVWTSLLGDEEREYGFVCSVEVRPERVNG